LAIPSDIVYSIVVSRPQVVIDTNVLVAAMRSRHGASARLLSLLGTGLFDIHVSVALVLEYEEVLMRQQQELGLSSTDVIDVVDALCHLAEHQVVYYRWRPSLQDPDDEMVLDLAVAAGCDVIVTFNQRDYAGAERFGLLVMRPKALLTAIGATA